MPENREGSRPDKLKVTGSIVTYNNAEDIENCIRSILTCTKGVRFTLYVIDNASTDDTLDIVKKNFPQVRIIRNRNNIGFGKGHNRMLPHLDSDYHVVINPDITLTRDTITELAAFMEKNKQAGIVSPKVLNPDGTEQYLPKRQPKFSYVMLSKFKPFKKYRDIYTMKDTAFTKAAAVGNVTGSFFMIRSELFKELNGFDDRYFMYFEDADIARSVREKGLRAVFYPKTNVIHKWKRDNTKSLKGIRIFLTSMLKYDRKWSRIK
ncbi:MAG: glycosyltransferase family 2 protein [Lachnospiraceae bacterium]|nr:glycosyltransferase family 2 protein [Lachnospiraceae bacterium]